MSQLLSHVSLSSLGETCASYLDHVATNLPPSLHTFHHQLVTTLSSAKASSALRLLPWPELVADHAESDYIIPVAYTLVACTVVLLAMSWRTPFANFWRRGSPSYTNVDNPPHVSDSDYSYITHDDIVDPPAPGYRNQYTGAEDSEPDTLILKHRKEKYELHFPAYAINDGALSVGQLRQQAAKATRTPDPNRIKLLYKGKLLDNDALPCRSEGLKQQSEVLCVVSGVEPGESSPSETSEAEAERNAGSARQEESRRKRSGKNKKRNGKNKKKGKQADGPSTLAPPAEPQQPSSAAGGSGMPSPSPSLNAFRTPLEQVDGLLSYLRRELLPLCEEYITNTPTDEKSRSFEYKKLSETILAQVILKADGIETSAQEGAREARKALIREAQNALDSLDKVNKD